VDSGGRTIFIADAHRGDGKHFGNWGQSSNLDWVFIKHLRPHNLVRNSRRRSYPAGMNPPDPEPMMSLDKFMEQSGLSLTTLWRWRKKGLLTTVNIYGRQ
jgi:hypothetical protein